MAKFIYGDRVMVCDEEHADFGKYGMVVERIPDGCPWITLDVPADDPYGGDTPPANVPPADYSSTRTTVIAEPSLELVVITTAGEVPMGGMFTTKYGGKFIRVNTDYVEGDQLGPKFIATLVLEPLDATHPISQWEMCS